MGHAGAWPLDYGSWLDAGGRWLLVGVMHAGLVGSLQELFGRRRVEEADLPRTLNGVEMGFCLRRMKIWMEGGWWCCRCLAVDRLAGVGEEDGILGF
ncbi:hypothetical protein ACLOJK_007078 [Asimina triloba]